MSMILNFFRDAYLNIKRNLLMSMASVISVMAALIIVGVIAIIAMNVTFIVDEVESNLEMKIYMADDQPEASVEEIGSRIQANAHVTELAFVSKDEALDEFASWFGKNEQLLQGYAEQGNPLPSSYVIKVDNAENLDQIYKEFINIEGVEDIVYGQEYVSALLKFNKMINTVSIVVVLILSIISLFTIYNTIKLTVFARRGDIDIMKYVGAGKLYIKMPFILEGSMLGVLGALVAVLLLRNIYAMVLGSLKLGTVMPLSASLAPFGLVIGPISYWFLLYGFIIGAVGSLISVSKFLRT